MSSTTVYGLSILIATISIFILRKYALKNCTGYPPKSSVQSEFADLDHICTHYKYSQQLKQPGQHLLCILPTADSNIFLISIIKDSLHGYESFVRYNRITNGDSLTSMYAYLNTAISLANRTRWRSYTFDGDSLDSFEEIISIRSFAIYTNGNYFIWPGVSVGFKRNFSGYTLETISLRPLVLQVKNFLLHDECEYIRKESLGQMQNSGLQFTDIDKGKEASLFRTSTQTFLSSDGRPVIYSIDARSAFVTRTSVQQQEYVQVLRYKKGQFYDQHYDYFDPADYKNDGQTLNLIRNGEKNRLLTVFWYLSTIQKDNGGHTIFPLANGNVKGYNHDYKNCDVKNALKVSPEEGTAIIFYSLLADGSLDRTSLHGACPVDGDDEKWAANKWVWSEDMNYILPS